MSENKNEFQAVVFKTKNGIFILKVFRWAFLYTINHERVVIIVERVVFVKLFGYHEYYDIFSFCN